MFYRLKGLSLFKVNIKDMEIKAIVYVIRFQISRRED